MIFSSRTPQERPNSPPPQIFFEKIQLAIGRFFHFISIIFIFYDVYHFIILFTIIILKVPSFPLPLTFPHSSSKKKKEEIPKDLKKKQNKKNTNKKITNTTKYYKKREYDYAPTQTGKSKSTTAYRVFTRRVTRRCRRHLVYCART